MKVLSPITITDAMLTSSTIPETDYAAYSAATSYAVGARCISTTTHRIYESVVASNLNHDPTVAANIGTYWLNVSPTNRWSAFDASISTASSATTSMTMVLKPGTCNSIAMLGLSGSTLTITQKDQTGGTVVYTSTTNLDGSLLSDWYMYFFEPFALLDTVTLANALLPYAAGEITVTLAGTGTVSMGVLAVGTVYDLGGTQYGATAGIIDYSTKTTDAFGSTVVTKRAYSKRMEARMSLQTAQLNKAYALLAALRSTPVVWIGTDSSSFGPLVVFGFYKDFSMEIAYPSYSLCSLQVEGVT